MAKKTKRQRQRASTTRRPAGPVTGQAPTIRTGVAAESEAETAPETAVEEPVARRRVERVDPAAARPQRAGRGPVAGMAMIEPLESDDAAIPFDRVPYVRADLRRVALIALLMVILIIIADIVVNRVVH